MEIKNEEKKMLTQVLFSKVEDYMCPICGNKGFVILDRYLYHSLKIGQDSDLESVFPTIAIVCKKCGFVSQHSLGMLGLIEKLKSKR